MNCEDFQNELDSIVEGRGLPTETLREHGMNCPQQACQQRWMEYLVLERVIAPWKSRIPVVDFTSIIKASLKSSQPTANSAPRVSVLSDRDSPPHRSSLMATLASVVVAGLLLALLTSLQSPRDPSLARRSPATGLSAESQSLAVVKVAGSDDEALQEISSKCVGWVEGATHRLTDAVTYVISPSNSPMDIMPPMRTPEDWLKTWGERLEPIEDSLDRTWRQLLEDSANSMGNAGDRTS